MPSNMQRSRAFSLYLSLSLFLSTYLCLFEYYGQLYTFIVSHCFQIVQFVKYSNEPVTIIFDWCIWLQKLRLVCRSYMSPMPRSADTRIAEFYRIFDSKWRFVYRKSEVYGAISLETLCNVSSSSRLQKLPSTFFIKDTEDIAKQLNA